MFEDIYQLLKKSHLSEDQYKTIAALLFDKMTSEKLNMYLQEEAAHLSEIHEFRKPQLKIISTENQK